jgi:hypothetical protein
MSALGQKQTLDWQRMLMSNPLPSGPSTLSNWLVHSRRSPMSALGQKQTSRSEIAMSALPPKADIGERNLDVRFVPFSDMAVPKRPHRLSRSFSG